MSIVNIFDSCFDIHKARQYFHNCRNLSVWNIQWSSHIYSNNHKIEYDFKISFPLTFFETRKTRNVVLASKILFGAERKKASTKSMLECFQTSVYDILLNFWICQILKSIKRDIFVTLWRTNRIIWLIFSFNVLLFTKRSHLLSW